jgi:hypothetical protein
MSYAFTDGIESSLEQEQPSVLLTSTSMMKTLRALILLGTVSVLDTIASQTAYAG